ncbi:MAG: DNA polymerase III subunit delta [Gemmatimonadota bacterium]
MAEPLDALRRTLANGAPPAAFYLHGAEDILKDEAVRVITDVLLDPSLRDFNLDQRSAASLHPDDIASLCYALPMMADRRVVIIRDVEQWKRRTRARSAMMAYLARPSPETVVVLVQGSPEPEADGELARLCRSFEFEPVDADQAEAWVRERAARLQVSFAPGALEHLVRAAGPDLGRLTAELGKLEAWSGGDPVTVDRVGELIGVHHGETADDWRDAVMDDRTPLALSLTSRVLDQSGMSGVPLVALLGRSLVAVGRLRAAYDAGRRGRALESEAWEILRRARPAQIGPWKEFVTGLVRWTPHWPAPRVTAALKAALETDRALKETRLTDEDGMLRQLVLRLAVEKREAA